MRNLAVDRVLVFIVALVPVLTVGAARADKPVTDLSKPADDDADDVAWTKAHGKEKARIEVPTDITFTVTDITRDTVQNGLTVIRATDLETKKKSLLQISLAPADDFFIDPRGDRSYPASALRYDAAGATGGTAQSGALGGARDYVTVLTCDAQVGSCQASIRFTLRADVRPTIAGDHTLVLMYRVATVR